jgi:hypothetical protein
MKYTIEQEPDIQTVTIKASGTINTEVAEEMILASGVALNYTDFKKCFIDLTNTTLDPEQIMVEMFMFVQVFKNAGINKSVKIAATIVSIDEFRLSLERYANLEGYKLKHFTTRKDAINWLYM